VKILSDYNINPLKSMGGVVKEQTLNEILSNDGAPHYNWVEQLRLATDFITPDNTLICVADSWLHDQVTKVTPIGLTQSFGYQESLPSALQPEIGSRRKRAMVGSSGGGNISISKMLVHGNSPIHILSKYGKTFGIDRNYWTEKEWGAAVGLNLDKLRTPQGIIVLEGDPAGRSFSCHMFEQCLCQGISRAYQAGSFLVVDNFSFIYEQIVPIWENDDVLGSHIDSY
jgi:hypothetical protein